jgi:hypothetical protein
MKYVRSCDERSRRTGKKLESAKCNNGAEMTSRERIGFWALPIIASIPAIIMLGMYLFFAFKINHLAQNVNQEFTRHILIILLASSALFLSIPLLVFYKIFRRRMRTGSFLPAGEELTALRNHRKEPLSQRKKMALVAFYLIGAIYYTIDIPYSTHGKILGWMCAAIFWIATAIFTVDLFRPAKREAALSRAPEEP